MHVLLSCRMCSFLESTCLLCTRFAFEAFQFNRVRVTEKHTVSWDSKCMMAQSAALKPPLVSWYTPRMTLICNHFHLMQRISLYPLNTHTPSGSLPEGSSHRTQLFLCCRQNCDVSDRSDLILCQSLFSLRIVFIVELTLVVGVRA